MRSLTQGTLAANGAGASTACVVKVFKLLENGDDYCNDYFNRDTEVTALRTAAGVPHTVEVGA